MTYLTLAIDAMGGDYGPRVTVPAALQVLASRPQLQLFLVGNPDDITPLLAKADSTLKARVQVVPAESVIASNDRLSRAIRLSRGSSMRVALELVQEKKAQGCISAGNTGVLMGLSTLLLKPLVGISRPALMAVLPHQQGGTVVLDLGANIQADSTMLVQFALMGAVMAEEVLGIAQPKVALLNIGQEETKGPDAIRDAAMILKTMGSINYIGYLEGNDLLTGKTDVLVCNGFAGNVALKTMEGVVKTFISSLKAADKTGRRTWWSAWTGKLMQRQLAARFGHLHPDHYNGACLLGLRASVIKSHGAADTGAFAVAIEQAEQAVRRQIPQRIAARLQTVLPGSDQA